MHLLARQSKFAGQAGSRFAFGDATQQQDQRGRRLPCFLERSSGQQRVVAITVTAAIGREVFLLAEQAAIGAPTVGADEAIRVQMALQPDRANAGIEQLGNRKVNHDNQALT